MSWLVLLIGAICFYGFEILIWFESGGINTRYEPTIGPLHKNSSTFSWKFNFSLLILNFSVSFSHCCSLLIQNFFFWCSISSILSRPLRLAFWKLLMNLLIQAVILRSFYNLFFSNNLPNVSEFSMWSLSPQWL